MATFNCKGGWEIWTIQVSGYIVLLLYKKGRIDFHGCQVFLPHVSQWYYRIKIAKVKNKTKQIAKINPENISGIIKKKTIYKGTTIK